VCLIVFIGWGEIIHFCHHQKCVYELQLVKWKILVMCKCITLPLFLLIIAAQSLYTLTLVTSFIFTAASCIEAQLSNEKNGINILQIYKQITIEWIASTSNCHSCFSSQFCLNYCLHPCDSYNHCHFQGYFFLRFFFFWTDWRCTDYTTLIQIEMSLFQLDRCHLLANSGLWVSPMSGDQSLWSLWLI